MTPSQPQVHSSNTPLPAQVSRTAQAATSGRPAFRATLLVILTGALAGFLAGLFGVGGGLIIVPALTMILDMSQREAAATSLCSIMITAAAGSIVYATTGQVSLIAMLLVSAGALIGAQIGVYLLRTLPEKILPWIFVAFVLAVVIAQQFHAPSRDANISYTALSCMGIIAIGVLSGIFSGLVGVGGGSVIVPGLELVIGAGDLLARGTSLLAMIPTAISGTVTNVRHHLLNVRVGILVGLVAALVTPLGTWVANLVSPRTGNVLFSCFLVFVTVTTILKARKKG